MDVKVFYNSANDFWRMYLDVEDLRNSYINATEWQSENDPIILRKLPL